MKKITKDTTFLVSGGARGITSACVIRLAQRYRCRFVLLGRTEETDEPEPAWAAGESDAKALIARCAQAMVAQGQSLQPAEIQHRIRDLMARREIAATLHAVREAGGDTYYCAVDVTDGEKLQRTVDEFLPRLGPISGLIHGASVLSDRYIQDKRAEDFELVFGAKVDGLKHLLAAIPPSQLEHIVLFASVAGFYGNIGQSDYAMANEVLNKVAHYLARTYPACCVHAFDWGAWDAGMVTPDRRDYILSSGVDLIPPALGTQVLLEQLKIAQEHEARAQTQMVVGSRPPDVKAATYGRLGGYRVRRILTTEANPFLNDHVIGGRTVLPLAHTLLWMSNLAMDLFPGMRFRRCEALRVLKGIVLQPGHAQTYLVHMQVVEGVERGTANDDRELLIDCRITSERNGANLPHYTARIILYGEASSCREPIVTPLPTMVDSSPDSTSLTVYDDGTLFHGHRFQRIQHLRSLNEKGLVAECESFNISLADQGQFVADAFDPFDLDTALQASAIWIRRRYGNASLPVAVNAIEVFSPLPRAAIYYAIVTIESENSREVTVNIKLCDRDGSVYYGIQGAQLTVSSQLNAQFQPTQKGERYE